MCDICPICQDKLNVTIIKILCGHIFHESCINEWTKYSNTCPYCRHILLEIPSINTFRINGNFYCYKCDYTTSLRFHMERHLNTKRHLSVIQ